MRRYGEHGGTSRIVESQWRHGEHEGTSKIFENDDGEMVGAEGQAGYGGVDNGDMVGTEGQAG